MTYEHFLKNLNARGIFRIHPGLARIHKVLDRLGNPENRWPSIHIAGTNGKGSVAASLESVLRASGYRTGLYTSPHLLDVNERVQIDGVPLTRGLTSAAEEVLAAETSAKVLLTSFELLTAVAFLAFTKQEVDIGIVECGLGGLWDATNVLERPLVSIITTVGLDHREWLGQKESTIARQKAGIIKSQVPVISGVQGSGRMVIAQVARARKAPLAQMGKDFTAQRLTSTLRSKEQRIRFRFKREKAEIIRFGLVGSYQADNAALVMATLRELALRGWSIPRPKRNQGLRQVSWPGRMQMFFPKESPAVLLDGAHNPQAMGRLVESIESSEFRNVHKTFVFSAFKDKDYAGMGKIISSVAAEVCLCPLKGIRKTEVSMLRSAFDAVTGPVRSFRSSAEALSQALLGTPRAGLVIVSGSLALVGEVLKRFSKTFNGDDLQTELTHV